MEKMSTIVDFTAETALTANGSHPGTDLGMRPPMRPNEEALWRWLDGLAEESERVRREEARFDDFGQYLDLFYGKHWPATMPSFRPPVVANELRSLILAEASDLTESKLRVYITKDPRTGGRDVAVERAFRAIWAREQIDLKLLYACCWALITGTGFLGVGWDPNAAYGRGDVIVDDIDPRHVLPDPDAIDDRKWLYVIREHVLDISEVRRLFPTSGWRVRPEDRWSIRDTKAAPTGSSMAAYAGPLTPSDGLISRGILGYKKARCRVLDCLVRDDSIDDGVEEYTDANGDVVLKAYQRPRFPNGRRIVGANGVILYDGDNPNAGGDFGILRVILEPALGRFWSTGFVQQTAELQLAADKLLSNVVENSIRLNNGLVVSTTNTGLDWESFAGIPAQIVQINPGSEFKIQYPPPMPPDMIQAPWRMLDLQRRLLGFQDARAGMPGRGNTSPDLTETEISQSQAPTRLRARMLYYTVQRLAEMLFARMANGYRTERAIPTVEGEEFKPVSWLPLDNPAQYAVYVDPSSFSVMSKMMLRRMGLALFKMRALDRAALLEMLEFPNWPEVSKRMNDADAASAKMHFMEKTAGKGNPKL